VRRHQFIYIASGAGVGPGFVFAGVCADALTCTESVDTDVVGVKAAYLPVGFNCNLNSDSVNQSINKLFPPSLGDLFRIL